MNSETLFVQVDIIEQAASASLRRAKRVGRSIHFGAGVSRETVVNKVSWFYKSGEFGNSKKQ